MHLSCIMKFHFWPSVSTDVWHRVSDNKHMELKEWGGSSRLVGVNGSPLHVQGIVLVHLTLSKNVVFEYKFLVVEGMTAEAILGLDFLETFKCMIDSGDRKISFPNEKLVLPLLDVNQKVSNTVGLFLQRKLTIPAESEVEVMVYIASGGVGDNPVVGTWLVERGQTGRCDVLVARAVVCPTGSTVPLRVFNPHKEAVRLLKGLEIAQMEPLDKDPPISSDTHLLTISAVTEVSPSEHKVLWDIVSTITHLSNSEKELLFVLLMEYADVFSFHSDLGRTNLTKHHIDTGDSQPIHQLPRRVSPACCQEVRQLLTEMLKNDIIQPSNRPWSSPIILVRKRDGSTRFCIDYRKVNSVKRKDAYPLPRVDDILDTLGGSKWFSTLDLKSGYWQVEVDSSSREKTAFTTSEGLYEFKVMSFGLCNAPATFQRLMNRVLCDVNWVECLVYIDDTVVIGRTFKQHLSNLGTVLSRLRQAGLKLQPAKCKLCQKEVRFLGHVISENGIATDPEKTAVNATWPVPESKKNIQQFLGLANYYRIKGLKDNLLGLPAIRALNLIVRVNAVSGSTDVKTAIMEAYPTLFHGLGTLGDAYEIQLKENAKPFSLYTARSIPIPLRDRVKEELVRMVSIGVISQVDQPTPWCAGIVVAPKRNGDIRICVDLKALNESVLREVYPLPTVDETLAQLTGATVFSKLDANSGFWQIPLADSSRLLTTFITPFGRYCFNKLPFGISSAPELFQKRMGQILEGLDGVLCQMDDVLVFGSNQPEHDFRLHAVLKAIKAAGVTLNSEKCSFSVDKLKFLGHVISRDGVSADPDKTKAILQMKPPTNITELRRFMGMVNQLGKFSPNVAQISQPLRELLSTKSAWVWGTSQDHAFSSVKTELTRPTVLALYNPMAETLVSADASSNGLGAVLLQKYEAEWRPVVFASRSMSETETRYAQIEKEALAISDPVTSAVIKYCRFGWPEKHRLQSELRVYWSLRGELTVYDGLLFFGKRLVIPQALQEETRQSLHQSHQGIQRASLEQVHVSGGQESPRTLSAS